MAQSTACNLSLQDPGLDDWQEKILLPPTDPKAEVMEIPGYKLVYVNGACPRNYRVYKADSMIGIIFQHLTHWSNAVDKVRYAEPVDAAVGLDEFMKVALKSTTAPEQPATEEELLDKEFDSLTSEEWERLKRYVPQTCLFGCSVRKRVGRTDPPLRQGANLNLIQNKTTQFIKYTNVTHRDITRI